MEKNNPIEDIVQSFFAAPTMPPDFMTSRVELPTIPHLPADRYLELLQKNLELSEKIAAGVARLKADAATTIRVSQPGAPAWPASRHLPSPVRSTPGSRL